MRRIRRVAIEFRVTRRPGAGRGDSGGRRNVGTECGWVMRTWFATWNGSPRAGPARGTRMP